MIALLAAQSAASPFSGSSLALLAAVIAIFRHKKAIGGWMLYFFFQVLIGVALILATTHWKLYLSSSWGDPLHYFLFTITNLSRLGILIAIAAVTMELFHSRDRQWVGALRLTLIACGFLGVVKLAVDLVYFPDNARVDLTSLAFPCVWIVYFSVSRRVNAVFFSKNWVE